MKSLHFRLLTVIALMLVLGLAGAGLADESNGKFKAALADNATFTVTENEQDQTYQLGKGATILIDAQIGALADLRAGDQVAVTWELRNDRRVASMVTCTRN